MYLLVWVRLHAHVHFLLHLVVHNQLQTFCHFATINNLFSNFNPYSYFIQVIEIIKIFIKKNKNYALEEIRTLN